MSAPCVWTSTAGRFRAQRLADALGLPMMIEAPVGDRPLVHAIGLDNPPAQDWVLRCTQRAERRVFWWDERAARLLFDSRRLLEDTHVCSFDGTRSVLLDRGVEPVLIPLPVASAPSPTPWPPVKGVLGIAQQDPFVSCFEVLASIKVVMESRGIPMSIVRDPDPNSSEFLGLLSRHSVVVELTVAESDWTVARLSMAGGRRCVVNRSLPHAFVAPEWDLPGLVAAIEEALSYDEPDLESSEYWREENSVETFVKRVEEAL